MVSPAVHLVLASIPVPGDQAPAQGLARAIQLSVAPVFLLTGISALIGVPTNRLSRVMDRADHLGAVRSSPMSRRPASAPPPMASTSCGPGAAC
jgi:hypothetical protein